MIFIFLVDFTFGFLDFFPFRLLQFKTPAYLKLVVVNEDEADRNGLALDCCELCKKSALDCTLFTDVRGDGLVKLFEDRIIFSCFSFFFFLESTQKGQNHLPFGAAFKPTHTK